MPPPPAGGTLTEPASPAEAGTVLVDVRVGDDALEAAALRLGGGMRVQLGAAVPTKHRVQAGSASISIETRSSRPAQHVDSWKLPSVQMPWIDSSTGSPHSMQIERSSVMAGSTNPKGPHEWRAFRVN